MPLLPLTSTMTRRKQADTPRLSLLHPVTHVLLRWGTDHGRHRLGVNRVPFIWLDAAGGPIRQLKRGWGRGTPMLSQPLQLTPSLGTLQTTVKLIKLPEKMLQFVWVACQRKEIRRSAIWRCLQVLNCYVTYQILSTVWSLEARVHFEWFCPFLLFCHACKCVLVSTIYFFSLLWIHGVL